MKSLKIPKEVIRIRKSKERQYNDQKTKDKEVIRIRKSKKDRQCNGQTKKGQRTNNDLQNTRRKTNDRATKKPTNKTAYEMNPGALEGQFLLH